MGIAGATAAPHDGGDEVVVFAVPTSGRHYGLLALEVQMDIVVYDGLVAGIYLRESLQAGDSFEDADAGVAECVVCAPCDRVYDGLCRAWSRNGDGVVSVG